MNIIGHKYIYLTVSVILVGLSVAAMLIFGFHAGIDFKGGTLWQIKATQNQLTIAGLESVIKDEFKISDARISYEDNNDSFLIRLPSLSEEDHQKFSYILKNKYPTLEELGYQSIGPSVGAELRKNALTGMALVLLGISLYIAFAFRRVYRPVSSWKYGLITLITLFHDVAIPAGLLAILGKFMRVEIDTNFIVALLVVVGFSVHDTIVVFDRIRENLMLDRGRTPFGQLINQSINQTFARSINTSFTLILVLVALYFTGPISIKYFVLTLLVGVTTGIYSSIFVASPLLVLSNRNSVK